MCPLAASSERPRPSRRDFLTRAAAATVALPGLLAACGGTRTGSGAGENRDPGRLVLGQIDESFHQVAGAVVHETLLELGHAVEVREGPHPEIYPLLGRGEVDLFATSWLPGGHGAYWEELGDSATEVTTLYEGARFFWAVPAYVPGDAVRAVGDLARSDVAGLMEPVLQGTGPGSGLMMRSERIMDEYGLARVGYELRTGTMDDVISTVNAAFSEERWFVTPLWQPQYLNGIHDLRPLQEPHGIFPAPDRVALAANTGSSGRLPGATVEALRNISLSVEAVTEMDRAVNVEGLSPREAARVWMERNPDALAARPAVGDEPERSRG